jgi:hypothetical protein
MCENATSGSLREVPGCRRAAADSQDVLYPKLGNSNRCGRGFFVCMWLLGAGNGRPMPSKIAGPLDGLQFTPQSIQIAKGHYCPNGHL